MLNLSRTRPAADERAEEQGFRLVRLGRAMLLSLGLSGVLLGHAQVLARPGWAGSGVAPEAWWLRAVFYRLDPARFQDSDGDGRGDLQGIVQRLDYLQSLGVDALLLDGPVGDGELGDLVREASRHHLRVLTTVRPEGPTDSRDSLLRAARASLSAGAAGVWLPKPTTGAIGSADYAALIAAFRTLLQSFPGERALLTDPAPPSSNAPAPTVRTSRRGIDPGAFGAARGGVLVAWHPLPVRGGDTSEVRTGLAAASQSPGPGLNACLRLLDPPAAGSSQALADAVLLLGGRGAVVLNFGQEIGLDTYPSLAVGGAPGLLPVMQWTNSNRTPAPVERTATGITGGLTPPATEFGAFHPYLRPPREFAPSRSASVRVSPDANLPAALPAPDTLPGFTQGVLPSPPLSGEQVNVASEDRDPSSLLHAYRRLIALHHGNAALRNGEFRLLAGGAAEGAIVWLRRAPAGARTAANVIGAANLSDQSVALSFAGELGSLGVRSGPVRALFASPAGELTGETTDRLNLPPHSVLLGEVVASRTELLREHGAASRHRVRR